jgi:hypothetical protein
VASARAAFEYRDFSKVVEILSPWVHPPRIANRERMKEARRLLGIALHVTGQQEAAADEFSQVLLEDPELKLDPFVVPPGVIQTFEAVREKMRPVLEPILERRRRDRARSPAPPGLTDGTHPLALYAPFGLSHFLVLDSPGWGALWLTLQLIGLGTNVGAYWSGEGLKDEIGFVPRASESSFETARVVQFAGLGFFALSWMASAIHGGAILDAHQERLQPLQGGGRARAGFSPGLAPNVLPRPPLSLRLRFTY